MTERKKAMNKKKTWKTPSLVRYGSVEKITLAPKGWGTNDGQGLHPGTVHPSL